MSFYGDLADTASRLIGVYGKDIMIKRSDDSIDPVTGVTTSGATQYYKTKGMFKIIPDDLVDGTRIMASDRMIVLSSDFEPELTDAVMINDNPWTIQEIKTSEPSNTVLVYFVRVRK